MVILAKVLLFQCEEEAAVRQILTPMKIKLIPVPKERMYLSLGELETEARDEGAFNGTCPPESLLVMCDFTEKQMNRLLTELRRKEIRIDYKAVLTSTNRNWDVLHMYFEMERERAMYRHMEQNMKK